MCRQDENVRPYQLSPKVLLVNYVLLEMLNVCIGNKACFAKIVGNKGTNKLWGGDKVKSLWGTREQRKNFPGNTGMQHAWGDP